MASEIEEAYAAGIWEGEGSTALYIGSGVNRTGLVYAVSVWQSNYTLLNWLGEKFGGGVYGRNGAGYGKESRKSAGEWRATGLVAFSFLVIIRQHLVFRQEEIDCMLEAWRVRADRDLFLQLAARRKEVRAKPLGTPEFQQEAVEEELTT